jgi:hypothetical protein
MGMVSVDDLRNAKRLSTASWESLSQEDRRYVHSLLGSMYHYYDDLATYVAFANGRIERLREALQTLRPGLVLDLRYADDDDDKDAMRARIETVEEALSATSAKSELASNE